MRGLNTGMPQLEHAAAAYDPIRERVVVFGGNDAGVAYYGFYRDTTYEWTGSVWQQISTPQPGGREGLAMAFDPRRGRVVLHGGYRTSGYFTRQLDDTWE